MAKKSHKKNLEGTNHRALKKNDLKRVSRGQDMYGHGEQKEPINLSLTPTAQSILTRVAKKHELSRSEYVERYLRSLKL